MTPHGDRDARARGATLAPPRSGRSAGQLLRERAPGAVPARRPSGPAPVARPWARWLLGAVLLLGTVTLVSCQALVAALSPGIYG